MIYARVATETAVVALAHTVYRGQVVAATDLTTVTLSGDPGVRTVPASARDDLVGQRAVYDLVEGSILAEGAIASVKLPEDKRALVGIKADGRPRTQQPPVPGFGGPADRACHPPTPRPASATSTPARPSRLASSINSPAPTPPRSWSTSTSGSDQAPVIALLASQDRLSIVRDADR